MRIVFLLLYSIISFSAFSQDNFLKQVTQLIKESAAKDAFSGNVIVVKEGKEFYKNNIGFADWEKKINLNDSTLFNIGSIGKDFTKVIMIQLASEGKLNLDDPLNSYIQIFPVKIGNKITLRFLLTMQSGLGDYHDQPFEDLKSRLNYIKTQPLLFEPGTEREYSNSGFVVLAAVIEKVTGKSFDQNVIERIFNPLKMNRSVFYYPGQAVTNKANGTFIKPNGKKVNEHEINDEATPCGDGGEYSTAPDLVKFYSSLLNDNSILNQKQKDIFFSDFDSLSGITLEKLKSNPKAVLGFAGGLNGWNACADIYFGMNQIVISVSNFDGQPAEELNHRIMQITRGMPYDSPQVPRLVFAYNQCKQLGAEKFVISIDSLLKQNNYDGVMGPYLFNQIAMALQEDKKLDDAKICCKRNIELFPDGPRSYLLLADLYKQDGNTTSAIEVLNDCLDVNPQCEEARNKLSKLKQ